MENRILNELDDHILDHISASTDTREVSGLGCMAATVFGICSNCGARVMLTRGPCSQCGVTPAAP